MTEQHARRTTINRQLSVPSALSPVADGPVPIIDSEDYRFVKFAVQLLDALAAEQGIDLTDTADRPTGRSLELDLARVRAALWLFERFPPADCSPVDAP